MGVWARLVGSLLGGVARRPRLSSCCLGEVERLGEIDEDTGNAWLIDGLVEAAAHEIIIDGRSIPVWSTGCDRLIVRPARARH
jgi:hypothetical protein